MTKSIEPIAIPGIHEKFYELFRNITKAENNFKILEVGAGHGAFTQRLYNDGYDVYACDLFPEIYQFEKILCAKADISKSLPYSSNSFDFVIAIEVMEHVHDHEFFFAESYRVLKNGGKLILSTPNILSLKSRVRFLLSGFFYSFGPLQKQKKDGLQHLASLTIDQYFNIGYRSGYFKMDFEIDKKQVSSQLLLFLLPFIFLFCKFKNIPFKYHNTIKLLTGRILFLIFEK